MWEKGSKRAVQHQPAQSAADASQCADPGPAVHRHGSHPHEDPASMAGHDPEQAGQSPPGSLQPQQTQSKRKRSMLDGTSLEQLKEIWDQLQALSATLKSMPMADGLKPLMNFASYQELLSLGGDSLLQKLLEADQTLRDMLNSTVPFLHPNGSCKSFNFDLQPVIGVIYGPTGCGKSQLLRNLLSSQLISPQPETIFLVAPNIDMIPPQEMLAWETQIYEGNFQQGPQGTYTPLSGTLQPTFVKLPYTELLQDYNYDVTHPKNVFARAAEAGPIAIILDECMEDIGASHPVSKFFHAFPSKLHDRYPKCTGYTLLVVLHNMNPRRDISGNISTLKIQSKFHIISPKMHPTQLNRFINTYTKGLPTAISLLLKDIFNFHNTHSKYDWIIYQTSPPNDCFQWMYMSPLEGLIPMYLNVHTFLYSVLEHIHKVLTNRQRWNRQYRKRSK
ncbi:maturation protein/encapsidation protein IVa2 [Mastadenovirus porcusquartum]|uniref:Packaging protein 1 n=1 Tax=Mastadenovirus porcusquartum TaxID=3241439 RepID=A0A7H0S568_9ADEN|nr:maturation protein/encapsidation protein IVa2 [Porcine mastadenovirus B]QNQ79242.1 maturation protein/encapsidation protein IVa2 [Porcine mastadenovirus B]